VIGFALCASVLKFIAVLVAIIISKLPHYIEHTAHFMQCLSGVFMCMQMELAKQYHTKLVNIKKEMSSLHEKTTQLKVYMLLTINIQYCLNICTSDLVWRGQRELCYAQNFSRPLFMC